MCVGAAWALWLVLQASGDADTTWVPLLAGAACWVTIYLLLPKPMWLYVVGHELTHAVWVWLFGGAVKKFKASAKGGHVIITKEKKIFFMFHSPPSSFGRSRLRASCAWIDLSFL